MIADDRIRALDAVFSASMVTKDDLEALAEDIAGIDDELYPEEQDFLKFIEQCSTHPEYNNGVEFISENYVEDYARNYAENISSINFNGWPFCYIDWTEAGNELIDNMTSYEWGPRTFYALE